MVPKSSSTAPEMRITAPALSSRAGLDGFTVTAAYACGRGRGRRGTVTSAPCTHRVPAWRPRGLGGVRACVCVCVCAMSSSLPRFPGAQVWMSHKR